jgi:transposase InsO family protein
MTIRRTIVELDTTELNVTQFCAQHGISTWFFWDIRRRYAAGGLAAIEPRSRAPHRVANKTSIEIEDAVVAKRKELADAGLDAGPASIAFYLRRVRCVPSEATIWRILTARGFIVADPSKRPKRSGRRFTAERANERWGLDDTGWELADATEVKILNVIDDHSRLLVASTALERCTGTAALDVLCEAAATLGWPERFLSDNAKAFRHTLATAVAELGVAAGHSRPYHPQTNGKVERFHQTLKQWLAKQPPAHTLEELQIQLDIFRYLYNHQRPHRGVNRNFPAQVWEHAPKSGPATGLLHVPTKIRRTTVHNGQVSASRSYLISIGSKHDGSEALVILTGLACHVFIDGQLIRHLTINPKQRSQPRNVKRGPAPKNPEPLP